MIDFLDEQLKDLIINKDRKIQDFCMQLLEFQAKDLFESMELTANSISSTNIEEGRKHAKELGFHL